MTQVVKNCLMLLALALAFLLLFKGCVSALDKEYENRQLVIEKHKAFVNERTVNYEY